MKLSKFLPEMDRGRVAAEIDEALSVAEAAVAEFGKASEVTLKFRIGPGVTNLERVVECTVSKKVPVKIRRPSLFFVNPDGDYQRDDPSQAHLFPEDADEKTAPDNITPMPQSQRAF